jgi:hypothetical protein
MNQNQINKIKLKAGLSLVEVVIGTAISLIVIIGLVSAFTQFFKLSLSNIRNLQASLLAEEGIEAVKFLRDKGYSTYIKNLDASTNYYLAFGDFWEATTTATSTGGLFYRTVRFEELTRDANKEIASSGTLDQDSKKVTVSVAFLAGGATSTKSISAYVMNIFSN